MHFNYKINYFIYKGVNIMEMQYFVRRSWTDNESQKGSFINLENAKKRADQHPDHKVYDSSGNEIYAGREFTVAERIEYAALWAKATAADNSHGYNNTKGKRDGDPDYACSSFVNEAYRQAGFNLPESESVYTAKMKSIYTKAGFEVVTDEVNLKTGIGLQNGDIVLAPGKHVEIYVGDGKLAGARGNANSGKPENGEVGDQTGNEITVSYYWNYPWTVVLRYPVNTPSKNQYVVQSGAYNVEENAKRLVEDLKSNGFSAIVKKEGNLYKVQCGVFNSEANAKWLRENLLEAGFKAIVKAV